MHLGAHSALQTREKRQLEVTVEIPAHISRQVFLKVQYKVLNRAVAVGKITSTEEFPPHE